MRVEIYSDIVCPWCYVGARRFQRALTQYARAADVEVIHRPYQLHPDAPTQAIPLESYLHDRFGAAAPSMMARVGGVAREEGIEIDWSRALSVNTLEAHRLLRLAETEYGPAAQGDVAEALFAAHFCHGGDVSDHALLTDLAVSAGLDRARVTRYLESGEGVDDTRYEIDQARRLGVRAVPTYVFEGRWQVQGAQSADAFLQALERVGEQLAAEAARGEPDDDAATACVDGSCAT